jgi:hypothetical protein
MMHQSKGKRLESAITVYVELRRRLICLIQAALFIFKKKKGFYTLSFESVYIS